jgi:diguanylate cyclase (GGDEF)-like protein
VDVVARYGGEEFVLLLPESDIASAAQVAERLRQAIANLSVPLDPDANTESKVVQVTVSLGLAMLVPDPHPLAALIDRADQALYLAKQAGRNRVQVSQ